MAEGYYDRLNEMQAEMFSFLLDKFRNGATDEYIKYDVEQDMLYFKKGNDWVDEYSYNISIWDIAEAVDAVNRLPRVGVLVLAGSLMGGKITETVRKLKEKHEDLIVITLNMPGSVTDEADLIVTDPIQAGVMAVMAVASTAVFDVKRLANNNKF